MKFVCCPFCGEKLDKKEIGDEGEVPYCIPCDKPIFDIPYTCIVAIAINEENNIALLKQDYISKTNYICVSGYIKTGETAEQTALREVEEELGLTSIKATYIKSYYYDKKDMLMLGFVVNVRGTEFDISKEVDFAKWFSIEEAFNKLRQGSIGINLLEDYLKTK